MTRSALRGQTRRRLRPVRRIDALRRLGDAVPDEDSDASPALLDVTAMPHLAEMRMMNSEPCLERLMARELPGEHFRGPSLNRSFRGRGICPRTSGWPKMTGRGESVGSDDAIATPARVFGMITWRPSGAAPTAAPAPVAVLRAHRRIMS